MSQIPRTYRVISATAAAACAAILATACSAPAARPAAATSPAAAASSTSPATAPSGAAPSATSPAVRPAATTAPAPSSPAPAPSASPPPGAQQCATSGLTGSIGQANGAAGSFYYPVVLTNTSGTACTLFGYPGVSFVTGTSGSELGGAAVRNPTFAPTTVTLAPGATAHASLQVVIAQNYPASTCKPVTAHWLRVYPPDQVIPLYIKFTAVTCTGTAAGGSTLGIYVVRPGPTGP